MSRLPVGLHLERGHTELREEAQNTAGSGRGTWMWGGRWWRAPRVATGDAGQAVPGRESNLILAWGL